MNRKMLQMYRKTRHTDKENAERVERFIESLSEDPQTQQMFRMMYIDGDKKMSYGKVAKLIHPNMERSCVYWRTRRCIENYNRRNEKCRKKEISLS